MLRIIAIIMVLTIGAYAVGNCDGAGNCYVANMATGTGTGADWANACTDFTGACDVTSASMRGTTIWVGGTLGQVGGGIWGQAYTTQNFSAPASGTQTITIRIATAENHGTETGFNKIYATGQVVFNGPINIITDYWTFDGQYRAVNQFSTESQGGGSYHDQGLGYRMQVNNASIGNGINISGSNVTIRYMYIQGAGNGNNGLTSGGIYGQTVNDYGISYSTGVHDEYFGYSWIAYTGLDSVRILNGTNFTFEYDMFSKNHMGPAGTFSDAISIGDVSGLIIRYNHFHNITGQAVISDPHADATPFTPNWYIYGNDIFWDTVIHTGTGYGFGGIVTLLGETLNGGVIHVYNNTIAGINNAACGVTQSCAAIALNLAGSTNGSCAAHTQNCIGATAPVGIVYNNLWWNPFAAINTAVASNAQWTPTSDYGEGICAAVGCSNNGNFFTVGPNDILVRMPFLNHTISTITRTSNVVTATVDSVAGLGASPITVSGVLDPSFNSSTPLTITAINGTNLTVSWNQTGPNATSSGGTINYSVVPFVAFNGVMGSPQWYNFNFIPTSNTVVGILPPGAGLNPPGCDVHLNCEINDANYVTLGANGSIQRGAFQINSRTLLTVHINTPGKGDINSVFQDVTVGSTFTFTQECSWSSAPLTDNCPEGNPPFNKVWSSLDKTAATINSSGVVTGVSPHNTFIRLYYGGINTGNNSGVVVYDGLGNKPVATLPTGIIRTGSPLAFSGYDTTTFEANFPTTFSDPCPVTTSTCTRWQNLTTLQALLNAISTSAPGDTIELSVGTTYTVNGTIFIPARSNPSHKWTYIVSSAMSSLPPQGTRVSPNNAVNMPTILETGNSPMIALNSGADHWWFAGIHFLSSPVNSPPGNAPAIITGNDTNNLIGQVVPDHIVVDRCYGNATADTRHGIRMNANYFAVLDSTIVGMKIQNQQAGALTAYFSNGPIKVINNLLSALGEDVIIGGAGGVSNQYVPSDIYFHHNTFWKDPAWRVAGISDPPIQYGVDNNLEFKMGSRVLVDGNVFINNWASDQSGNSIAFNTVTSTQQGPNSNNNDITISNNITMYETQGMTMTAFGGAGEGCTAYGGVCSYPTEARRLNVFNNVYMQGPQGAPGGAKGGVNYTALLNRLATDWIWQHNTWVAPYLSDAPYCQASTFLQRFSFADGVTQNLWLLDNVMCRQAAGYTTAGNGTAFLQDMMAIPATPSYTTRFVGNMMQYFTSQGDTAYTWPAGNQATPTLTYVDPVNRNYQLSSPILAASDGAPQVGINYSNLISHQRTAPGSCSISGTVSGAISSGVYISIQGQDTLTILSQADGTYTIPNLAGGSYTVYAFAIPPFSAGAVTYSITPNNIPVTLTSPSCASIANNFSTTASATYNISGTITSSGVGLGGVTIALSGTSTGSTTTNSSGNYTFANIGPGTYTLRPSLTNYTFSPTSLNVTVTTTNITGQNFTATQIIANFSISGTISGSVISGVTLNLTGTATGVTVSAANGTYSFPNLHNGSYTITPSLSNYIFSPSSLAITINNANVLNQNFVSLLGTTLSTGHIGPSGTAKKSTTQSKPK